MTSFTINNLPFYSNVSYTYLSLLTLLWQMVFIFALLLLTVFVSRFIACYVYRIRNTYFSPLQNNTVISISCHSSSSYAAINCYYNQLIWFDRYFALYFICIFHSTPCAKCTLHFVLPISYSPFSFMSLSLQM